MKLIFGSPRIVCCACRMSSLIAFLYLSHISLGSATKHVVIKRANKYRICADNAFREDSVRVDSQCEPPSNNCNAWHSSWYVAFNVF